jgi:hypothetical protein
VTLFDATGRRVDGFHDRTRAARRRMHEIQRMTPRARKSEQTEKYQSLIGVETIEACHQLRSWKRISANR